MILTQFIGVESAIAIMDFMTITQTIFKTHYVSLAITHVELAPVQIISNALHVQILKLYSQVENAKPAKTVPKDILIQLQAAKNAVNTVADAKMKTYVQNACQGLVYKKSTYLGFHLLFALKFVAIVRDLSTNVMMEISKMEMDVTQVALLRKDGLAMLDLLQALQFVHRQLYQEQF